MDVKHWIGLDPSIAAFGYAVLRRGPDPTYVHCIDAGTWKTRIEGAVDGKSLDRARRVRELTLRFSALLDEHDPVECVYSESPALGMATSRLTAQVLGRVFGNVEGVCADRGIDFAEITPQTLKRVVAGKPGASKEEVARIVRAFYARSFNVARLDDNGTDALAAAHVGAYRHGNGVTVSSGVVSYRRDVDADEDPFDLI